MMFSHPLWLLAGVGACLGLVWMWRRYDARQRSALARFVAPHLRAALTRSVSQGKARAKRALLLGAVALLFVALAGPKAGYRWEEVTRRGNDILFAVDTSRSMLTPDVKPNRLTRAKLAIDDFVQHLDGDAVGLIAFAGDAFLQSPLTLDYDAFHDSLNALDTRIIPRGGTNIASAIQEAQTALKDRPGSDKILVLVTDGEDLQGNALSAAKAAAQQGLKIYTVGVGTANGDLIALPPDQGGGFVKDAAGNPIKSHLNETALKAIAAATGGLYAPLGAEGQGLTSIYQQALAPLTKHDLASRRQKIYTQRYQWPLAAGLGMLLASVLMGTRRRIPRRHAEKVAESTPARRILPGAASLSALLLLAPLHPAHASTASAAKAYAKGDYAAAEQAYAAAAQRDPKAPALQYNLGTAAYRAGEFPEAAAAFESSLAGAQSANAKRLAEQQNAYYDLGNTLYRTGQKTEQSNPEQTIQIWTQAVKAYDTALQLRTSDADSKFNRDLVMRKLEQLKQKKQSQQSQQQKPSQSGGNGQQKQQAQNQQGRQDQPGKQGQQEKQASQGKDSKQAQNSPSQQNPQPSSGAPSADQSQTTGQPNPNQSPPPVAGQPPPGAPGTNAAADQRQDETIADNQRAPGQMSREEARELLDSVKDELHRYPAAPLARTGANSFSADQPTRDW
jgi:Ca-activated chloride channel family protein